MTGLVSLLVEFQVRGPVGGYYVERSGVKLGGTPQLSIHSAGIAL